MRKCIFDIETDGLLDVVSKVHCLVLRDIENPENVLSYTESNIEEGLKVLGGCSVIAGHNIIGFDLVALNMLYGWKPGPDQKVWDTWILSQLIQYKRSHRHSLKGWGEFLGDAKTDYKGGFETFSQEMLDYCIQDTMVNIKVYQKCIQDLRAIVAVNPLFQKGIDVEHKFAFLEAEIQHGGWNFDMDAANELISSVQAKMDIIAATVEPKIGVQKIYKDAEPKSVKYKADGTLYATSQHMIDDPATEVEWIEPGKTFRRFSMEPPNMSSIEVLKQYLYSIGWEPTEWNVERLPNGQFIQKSPKLTEESLENLPDGPAISEYLGLKNRLGVLKGWVEHSQKDGRLHGRMWTIGTPTFRCRHEVIANLPGVDSLLGKDMRGLLRADPGFVLVGADSSGNQMRGLCHYLGNEDFTHEVINGDVHQRNADILGISRKTAKSFLYAFLFGAGPSKLAMTGIGRRDVKWGKDAIEKFTAATPGLGELRNKLSSQWNQSKIRFSSDYAYVSGIDGRLIFVESEHQILNYLLQTLEGITCKAAAVWLKDELVKRGIEHKFLLHYHDELAVQVRPDQAELVKELAVQAFTDAPKWFGVNVMSGAAQIGQVYADIH